MPVLATLDRRQANNTTFALTELPEFDPNNDFNKTIIESIVEDTNERHNREAPHHNVTTLVANAYAKLCIATSNLAA